MVDFGGWDMPVQYTSIVDEHQTIRNQLGLFDIGHMGRVWVRGPEACAFLQFICTNDISTLADGQVRYNLVCNEKGFILDDILVYRIGAEYLLVINASNRIKIVDWLGKHISNFKATLDDQTLQTGMIALQGPLSIQVADEICPDKPSTLKYYFCKNATVLGHFVLVSRTGYTGEDGIEIIAPKGQDQVIWDALIARGIKPCGLGARDTLRLEAGMPLYGHEIDEATQPLEAGLGWAVKLEKGAFSGKAPLVAFAGQKDKRKRVGLEVLGRRIPREGCLLIHGNATVGKVTSGTFSPTFQKPLAMGYLPENLAAPGTEVEVDIRGNREKARVVPIPFYKRPRQ